MVSALTGQLPYPTEHPPSTHRVSLPARIVQGDNENVLTTDKRFLEGTGDIERRGIKKRSPDYIEAVGSSPSRPSTSSFV